MSYAQVLQHGGSSGEESGCPARQLQPKQSRVSREGSREASTIPMEADGFSAVPFIHLLHDPGAFKATQRVGKSGEFSLGFLQRLVSLFTLIQPGGLCHPMTDLSCGSPGPSSSKQELLLLADEFPTPHLHQPMTGGLIEAPSLDRSAEAHVPPNNKPFRRGMTHPSSSSFWD